MMSYRRTTSLLAAMTLAATLAWSGGQKVAGNPGVVRSLDTIAGRMLPTSILPTSLKTPVVLLGLVEIGIGLMLLVARLRNAGATAAGLFVVSATVVYGVATKWGALVFVECGCGLSAFTIGIGNRFGALLIRNAVLLMLVSSAVLPRTSRLTVALDGNGHGDPVRRGAQ